MVKKSRATRADPKKNARLGLALVLPLSSPLSALTRPPDPKRNLQRSKLPSCQRSFKWLYFLPSFCDRLLCFLPSPTPSCGGKMPISLEHLGKCNNSTCAFGCGIFYCQQAEESGKVAHPGVKCDICGCGAGQHMKSEVRTLPHFIAISLTCASQARPSAQAAAASTPVPSLVPTAAAAAGPSTTGPAMSATASTLKGSRPALGPFRALAEERQSNIHGSLPAGTPFHPAKQVCHLLSVYFTATTTSLVAS